MIELDPGGYISWGGHRLIYEHPSNKTQLIKVVRPDQRQMKAWSSGRAGSLGDYVEELSEYTVLRSRDPNTEPLVAPVHGLVDTSMGLGLVVEKISRPDGFLSPTLDDLIREDCVTTELRRSIDILAQRLAALHVVVSDFRPSNLALRPDRKGFCVIDGLGETSTLRFRKLSSLAWRVSLERMRRHVQSKIILGQCRKKRDRRGPSLRSQSSSQSRSA